VVPQQPEAEKRAAYQADITYATNNELGFDYLRDNMESALERMRQRGHNYAIVDEVDSILVDEARTPLIISGPAQDRSELYIKIDDLIPGLPETGYEVDEKTRNVTFTDEGNDALEATLRGSGPAARGAVALRPRVDHARAPRQPGAAGAQAVPARQGLHRPRRQGGADRRVHRPMMIGRRLSDGLHQAIEAKEGVKIEPENVTLASVTFQNYFRLYRKLAGMTGTALTEADEFHEIYGLGVVGDPHEPPVARKDEHDAVYRTAREKYEAIVKAIREPRKGPAHPGGHDLDREVRDAVQPPQEGRHPAQRAQRARARARGADRGGGRPARRRDHRHQHGGRGTDIQLGGNVEMKVLEALAASPRRIPTRCAPASRPSTPRQGEVKQAGGLYVLATERHESRRIDNQLADGRGGRATRGGPRSSCRSRTTSCGSSGRTGSTPCCRSSG
jgi:preprotein translocase subunit SecA